MKRKRRNKQGECSKVDIYDQLFDVVEMDDLSSGDVIEVFMDDVLLKRVRVIEDDEGDVQFC